MHVVLLPLERLHILQVGKAEYEFNGVTINTSVGAEEEAAASGTIRVGYLRGNCIISWLFEKETAELSLVSMSRKKNVYMK